MPGTHDADAFARAAIGVRVEEPPNPPAQRGHEPARLARRRHAHDARPRPADRVGEHQERAARADVDGHARSLVRVDIEQRRLAAARRLPRVALDDVSAVQQLLDQQGRCAAPQLHAPREVGARDRLMAADERQGDLDG